jgi:hypothetical protein
MAVPNLIGVFMMSGMLSSARLDAYLLERPEKRQDR